MLLAGRALLPWPVLLGRREHGSASALLPGWRVLPGRGLLRARHGDRGNDCGEQDRDRLPAVPVLPLSGAFANPR